MSKYDSFTFISSDIIISEVKQQLKSYFDSGSLTEVLIPTYISTALRKLHHMVLEAKEDIIIVEDYRTRLPEDFEYLGDAFLIDRIDTVHTTTPITNTYEYYKKIYCHDSCENEYETFSQQTLTTPTWVTNHLSPVLLKVYYGSKNYCVDNCQGLLSQVSGSLTEVKVNGKTLSANFQRGTIFIKYFSTPTDDSGPLIPDVIEVEDYIKAYITFQLFDQLYNAVTDESINIIERKRALYKQEYYGKYEAALNMMKSQTKQQIRDGVTKDRKRFIKYIIN